MEWQTEKYGEKKNASAEYHSCLLQSHSAAKVLNNKIDKKEYRERRSNEEEEEKQQNEKSSKQQTLPPNNSAFRMASTASMSVPLSRALERT